MEIIEEVKRIGEEKLKKAAARQRGAVKGEKNGEENKTTPIK